MELDMFQRFLGWCTVINIGVMLWWFFFITFAHDWVYRLHTHWFNLSEEQFDAFHYSGIAIYKLFTFFFNVVPYLALCIIA